jgi:hypothetical protein
MLEADWTEMVSMMQELFLDNQQNAYTDISSDKLIYFKKYTS